MFETTVVESKLHPIRKGRYVTLPVSVALHVLAISGAIASSVWSVSFPTNSPSQYESFAGLRPAPVVPPEQPPVRVELPKPNPTQSTPQPVFSEPPPSNPTILTPGEIPNEIPNVEPGGGGPAEIAVGDPSAVHPGGGGGGGEIGNVTPMQVGPGRATMPEVLRRVQPIYPHMLVSVGLPGSAVVECVVGRDGVIESATVVRATHQLFGAAARDAVMPWKFLPGRLRGEPVATIFQLTVNFEVRR